MKFFSVLLALFLASCGASVNFMQYGEQVSYTRTSSSIFIKNKSSVKKIFIVLQNGTPYSEFNDISDIIKTKIGNKYIVTDSVSDADLVIHLNVRQFTRIEPETMSNIEKYWQYTETTDNLTLSDINATTFGIAHDGVVISDAKSGKINIPSGGSQKADQGIISKLATNDFLSGMSIGGLQVFGLYQVQLGQQLVQ
ncbi:hypothetical protein [Candidatus Deianiraea vastatrix]|uniref:Lipoprotein n=1 Tax=Candidatus Deianiraea vastatrix TaxID=2163644 RepID=A0A5B8XF08_9RICK|nr:hypothetical protein [Candidatus Deianiraea vastatrix]QED23840.1 hypothetical protein Deia_01059 [Candidatus Deianiraea vastatrix]